MFDLYNLHLCVHIFVLCVAGYLIVTGRATSADIVKLLELTKNKDE